MVKEAEKEYKELQKRYDELSEWISGNIKHPDFTKKVSERNDISVRMEVKRQQKNGNWDVPYQTMEVIYTKPTHVNY